MSFESDFVIKKRQEIDVLISDTNNYINRTNAVFLLRILTRRMLAKNEPDEDKRRAELDEAKKLFIRELEAVK